MKELYKNTLCTNTLQMEHNTIFPTIDGLESQIRQARKFCRQAALSGYSHILIYNAPEASFKLYSFSLVELIPQANKTFIPIPIRYTNPANGRIASVTECAKRGFQNILDILIPNIDD